MALAGSDREAPASPWSTGLDPCEPELPALRLPEGGRRLQAWLVELAATLPGDPRRLMAEGRVRLDGRSVLPGASSAGGRPAAGTVLAWVPAALDPARLAEAIPVPILHEDPALMVIDKPAALVVTPGPGHPAGTLTNGLRSLGRPLSGVEAGRPGLVHRLDRGVSGALLVAKDDATHRALVRALAAREVEREYLALVLIRDPLSLPSASGERTSWLGQRRSGRKARASVDEGTAGAQAAQTCWSQLARSGGLAWLSVRPLTGRQHQIRVHLAEAGLPLVGDLLYGGLAARHEGRRLGLHRPALHAARVALPHPSSGALLEVQAPLPDDLRTALGRAGL